MVTHYILSQYGTEKGTKMFGVRDVIAVRKELHQIHYRKMIQTKLPRDLTSEQKIRSLSYQFVLKKKRYG